MIHVRTLCFYTIFSSKLIRILPDPTENTESTITEVFNVRPGDNPELGDYEDIDGATFCVLDNLIVTYTSYLILKQATPEVTPHILYALAYGGNRDTMGEIAGIDYGPVGRIFDQYARWPDICDGGSVYPNNILATAVVRQGAGG
jgi:hypothetical protein